MWFNKDKYYNTKSAELVDNNYYSYYTPYPQICAYCGKHLRYFAKENKDGVKEGFYNCDCEDAQKEHEIQLKIEELREQMPKPKVQLTREITIKQI